MMIELATLALSSLLAAGLAMVFFVVMLITTETKYLILNRIALFGAMVSAAMGIIGAVVSIVVSMIAAVMHIL